jgi:hypothetical protein
VEVYEAASSSTSSHAFTHIASLDLPAAARPAALALDRLGQLHVGDAAGNGLFVGNAEAGLVARPDTGQFCTALLCFYNPKLIIRKMAFKDISSFAVFV